MLAFLLTCIMKLMLRHVRVGCGVGEVMLMFLCTCIMKLMLRHVRVGCGVGGVMLTFLCTCIDHQYSVYESIASHCFRWVELLQMGTQCIDRKWQSLKKWIPKELSNKQKFTRDVKESIRDYVSAFVC